MHGSGTELWCIVAEPLVHLGIPQQNRVGPVHRLLVLAPAVDALVAVIGDFGATVRQYPVQDLLDDLGTGSDLPLATAVGHLAADDRDAGRIRRLVLLGQLQKLASSERAQLMSMLIASWCLQALTAHRHLPKLTTRASATG